MVWHIAKRDIYNNLNSLRFALTTVLLLALMLTNAVWHLQEHPEQMQKYRTSVTESLNALTSRADSLYELAQKGPGLLYKKPSPLRFCSEGVEILLPDAVEGRSLVWNKRNLKSFWRLTYPSATLNLLNVRPDVTKVDWGFVIGYILSFIALLFSFDSISGEREQGTLRLMLSNSIPRHTILIGKFLGGLISIIIPFSLAVLMNLLVISTSSDVQLSAEAWGRLSIIFFIAVLYTCFFLALGLLVSARVQQSAVSLVILLLAWVVFVVFMPSMLASIASGFSSPMTINDFHERKNRFHDELWEEYKDRIWDARGVPFRRMQLRGEFVVKDAQQDERLNEEYLTQQISQVSRARAITHISPATVVDHLLESFSGTGFKRHLHFLENVQRYTRQYRQFVIDTDRADLESLHIIGVRSGMSQQAVRVATLPKFEDELNLTRDFNTTAVDLLLLVLFLVILLFGAYLSFLRTEE